MGKKRKEGPWRNYKLKCRIWKSYVSCQDTSSCPIILLLPMFGLAFLRRQREMKSVLAQNPKILWHNSYHKTEFQMDSMTFLQEEMTGDVGNKSLPKSFTQCSTSSYLQLERQPGQKEKLSSHCLPHAWYEWNLSSCNWSQGRFYLMKFLNTPKSFRLTVYHNKMNIAPILSWIHCR